MRRILCGLAALSLLACGAGRASGQSAYVYTTLDVPGYLAPSFLEDRSHLQFGQLGPPSRLRLEEVVNASVAKGIKPGERIVQAWRATGWWPATRLIAQFVFHDVPPELGNIPSQT